MNRNVGFIALGAGALALIGCQQEASGPAKSAGPADDRAYVREVQKLKAQPLEDFETRLAALDARFGLADGSGSPSATVSPSASEGPEAGAGALGKAAATQVYNQIRDCKGIFRRVINVVPGDILQFNVQSQTSGGVASDPVAMLIRYNNTAFIDHGVVPESGQGPIIIVARNDDAASDDLSSLIDYTFQPGQGGYYMLLSFPFSNSHSARTATVFWQITRVNCSHCQDFEVRPDRWLGGSVYRSQGANDFRVTRVNGDGNPRVYVLMNTWGSGVSNGDATLFTRDSKVFPYSVTAAQGGGLGNIVLIDNEELGTASFRHTQYTP